MKAVAAQRTGLWSDIRATASATPSTSEPTAARPKALRVASTASAMFCRMPE